MRVSIDGQEPFLATKGFMVQVPYRVSYSIETEGSEPSLRFEVIGAQAVPLYPVDETPAPVDGKKYMKVTYTGHGAYDEINKPYLDFHQGRRQRQRPRRSFRQGRQNLRQHDSRPGQPPPPASNLGHFHIGYSEFWLIPEGKIDYLIEGVPFFTAEPGDVRLRASRPLASRQLRRQWRGHSPRYQSAPGRNA